MPKVKDHIEAEGMVEDILPGAQFRVKLDNGHMVIAHLAGKLRMHRIMIGIGDKVKLEMSPYDLTKGRITYRS